MLKYYNTNIKIIKKIYNEEKVVDLKETFSHCFYTTEHPVTGKKGLYMVFKQGNIVRVLDIYGMEEEKYYPHFWVEGNISGDIVIGNRKYGYVVYDDKSIGFTGVQVSEVKVWKPYYVPVVRKWFRKRGLVTFESQVRFADRFLIDHGIRPYTRKFAFWDIEVDRKTIGDKMDQHKFPDAKIISIAVVGSDGRIKVFADSDEKKMLSSFIDYVVERYDLLVGYNSGWEIVYSLDEYYSRLNNGEINGFDLPVINTRLLKMGMYEYVFKLRLLDYFDIMYTARALAKTSRGSLDEVARRLLGTGKRGSGMEVYKMKLDELLAYNINDAYLLSQIETVYHLVLLFQLKRSLGYIASMSNLMGIVRLKGNELPSQGNMYPFINMLMAKLSKRVPAVRLMDKDISRKIKKIEGGYVHEPVPGLYNNVVVLDLSGTYPSTIIQKRIDPTGTGAFVELEQELVSLRSRYKKKKKQARDPALKEYYDLVQRVFKILANSGYGILGFYVCDKKTGKCSFSPLYSPDHANMITGTAREVILYVIQEIEKRYGIKVVYGDTDSVMLWKKEWKDKTPSQMGRIGELLLEKVNDMIKQELGYDKIKMKFEKVFCKVVFYAKKRYSGLVCWEDGATWYWVHKGHELVRRDAPLYIRSYLEKLFELVEFGVPYREALELVKDMFMKDIYSGVLDTLMIKSATLKKRLEEYKQKAPHVQAVLFAREKLGYEYNIGDRVYYVKTRNGWKPWIPGVYTPVPDRKYFVELGMSTFDRYSI